MGVKKYTTIGLSKKTKDELSTFGTFKDSFEKIIQRLLRGAKDDRKTKSARHEDYAKLGRRD